MYRSERRYDDHKNIYSDILQNAPFHGQIFKNFLRLRRQGGIDSPNQNSVDALVIVHRCQAL